MLFRSQTKTLQGWGEYSGGFGSGLPYRVYFCAKIKEPVDRVDIVNFNDSVCYAKVTLLSDTKRVNLGIGISMKNRENAEKFLSSEIGNNSFENIKHNARTIWNKTLSKIDVKGGSESEKKLFYTALYHSFLMPRDRTEDNPWWDSSAPHLDDHYCVWDTWRTKYPLMVLINESFVTKTINSFIDRFENNKKCMPTFTSSLDSPNKQGGDDVDNIIADALNKGVKGFDANKAYEIMLHNAFSERSKEYLKYGWQPETGTPMSCSSAMEFAYNDFCTSTVAEKMNDNSNAIILKKRSNSWIMLFDSNLTNNGFAGFIVPKNLNREWIPINPEKNFGSWVEYFYEEIGRAHV